MAANAWHHTPASFFSPNSPSHYHHYHHLQTPPKTTAKMGRELQKKKNRSSIPKQTKRKNPRVHKVRPLGNALVAQNWYVPPPPRRSKFHIPGFNYKLIGKTQGQEANPRPELQASRARLTPQWPRRRSRNLACHCCRRRRPESCWCHSPGL